MVRVARSRLGEDKFWRVVARCLNVFFGYKEQEADQLIHGYREQVLATAPDAYALIMHQEPFSLAGILAGKELDFDEKSREIYINLLAEAGEPISS